MNGNWIEDPTSVKQNIFDHFRNQFSEPKLVRPRFESSKFKSISDTQAAALECLFTEDEIHQAVWSFQGLKAPGPDGYSINFLKNNWDLLKSDFTAALLDFHHTGHLPRGCNSAFVTLIPKAADPQLISGYRPISLVSLQYKVCPNYWQTY